MMKSLGLLKKISVAAVLLCGAAAAVYTPLLSAQTSPGDYAVVDSVVEADVELHPDSVTAAMMFESAPLEVIPTIDETTRLDMIDYFEAGMDRPSKNNFGGQTRITSLSPDQITFTTSDSGESTISLVGKGKERVAMFITTVKTPAEDSNVRFYSLDWKPIVNRYFMVPDLNDWTLPSAASKKEDLENAVPFMLAKMEFDPASGELTLTNNLGSYLPEEVTDLVGNSLRNTLTYVWTGKGFRLKK